MPECIFPKGALAVPDGVEPSHTESKSVVLPLDERTILSISLVYIYKLIFNLFYLYIIFIYIYNKNGKK